MPKFAAHMLIAEEASRRAAKPFYADSEEHKAYLLGAIGPDLTLFLFDAMKGKSDAYRLFIKALDVIDKVGDELKKADSVIESVDSVTDWITGGLKSSLENTAALLVEGAIAALKVGLLFDVTVRFKNPFEGLPFVGDVFNLPEIEITPKEYVGAPLRYFGHPYTDDPGYKEPAAVGSYTEWWWMDVLHYRRTLEFAKDLQRRSNRGIQLAYANGYLTHVGGDICGHPFVNSMVGGPFRNHAQRHMVLETLMDTWLWDWANRGDICEANLKELIDLSEGNFRLIASTFRDSLHAVYDKPSLGRARIHPGLGFPSEDDLFEAYTGLCTYLERTTTLGYKKPTPPPSDPGSCLKKISKVLQRSLERAQFPPAGSITWEWLWAAFSAAIGGLVFLLEVITLPLATVAGLAALSPRWLLYLIQAALYDFVSEIRWLLALQGWGYASRDDLGRDFVKENVRTQPLEIYPYAMTPREQGFWLRMPSRLGAQIERDTTTVGPFDAGTTPDVLITGASFDQQHLLELQELSRPTPFTPHHTAEITERLRRQAPNSLWLGNAPDFSLLLIQGEYPPSSNPPPSFDLDGDRGYGYLSWEEYPRKGERYTSSDGGPL